jgi:hypothetical protein
MGRTIIIGDLHGCRAELEDLLAYVGHTRDDRVVCVGDLVVRGPDPRGTLAVLRGISAEAVLGNHEDRLLRWRAAEDTAAPIRLGQTTRRTALALKTRDFDMMSTFPLWIDLPEHGVRVVHAGLVPGVPIESQERRTLLFIRTLGERREPLEARGTRSWAHSYEGPEHVVFGHNAMPEPEIAEHATGIDTGAVYGGRLTAMVLRAGETVPPKAERRSVLVSVPARKAYYLR